MTGSLNACPGGVTSQHKSYSLTRLQAFYNDGQANISKPSP